MAYFDRAIEARQREVAREERDSAVTYEQMALDLQAQELGGPGRIPTWKEEAHGKGGAQGAEQEGGGETLVFDDGMQDHFFEGLKEDHFFEGLKEEEGGGKAATDVGEGRVSSSRGSVASSRRGSVASSRRGSVASSRSGVEEGSVGTRGTDDGGVGDDNTDTQSERPNSAELASVQETGDKAREAFVSTPPPQGVFVWGVPMCYIYIYIDK